MICKLFLVVLKSVFGRNFMVWLDKVLVDGWIMFVVLLILSIFCGMIGNILFIGIMYFL